MGDIFAKSPYINCATDFKCLLITEQFTWTPFSKEQKFSFPSSLFFSIPTSLSLSLSILSLSVCLFLTPLISLEISLCLSFSLSVLLAFSALRSEPMTTIGIKPFPLYAWVSEFALLCIPGSQQQSHVSDINVLDTVYGPCSALRLISNSFLAQETGLAKDCARLCAINQPSSS